jgi:hypothetical protein
MRDVGIVCAQPTCVDNGSTLRANDTHATGPELISRVWRSNRQSKCTHDLHTPRDRCVQMDHGPLTQQLDNVGGFGEVHLDMHGLSAQEKKKEKEYDPPAR